VTAWTATRERRAIVAHVARCAFCRSLVEDSRRRQDRELLAAAERLASEHAVNDHERALFCRRA